MNILVRLLLAAFLIAAALSPASAQRAFLTTSNTASSSTTTTTSATALTIPTQPPRNMVVRVFNSGTATVFVAFGTSGVTAAAATALPMPAGAVGYFTVPEGTTHAATIIGTGTATVYFTVGEGIS